MGVTLDWEAGAPSSVTEASVCLVLEPGTKPGAQATPQHLSKGPELVAGMLRFPGQHRGACWAKSLEANKPTPCGVGRGLLPMWEERRVPGATQEHASTSPPPAQRGSQPWGRPARGAH